MAHMIKLGYKRDPSGTDDYIDFPATTGYHMNGINFGQPYVDNNGHKVRDINLLITYEGTSVQDMQTKVRKIDEYLQTSRIFFDQVIGRNRPANMENQGFDGWQAILSFKPQNATKTVYYEVLTGEVIYPQDSWIDSNQINSHMNKIQVKITCNWLGKGDQVLLQNGISMGNFEPPFKPGVTGLDYGWTFPNSTHWTGQYQAGVARYGYSYMRWSAASSTTAYSNEVLVTTSAILLPRISYVNGLSGGTFTVKLQIWNGASWTNQQTLISITSATASGSWVDVVGTTYTVVVGITKVRLEFVSGTSGSVYFGGVCIWLNPVGSTVPTEIVSNGVTVGQPACYVYNVQGDVEAPVTMLIDPDPLNATVNQRVYIVGAQVFSTKNTASITSGAHTLDNRVSTGTATATTLFWGVLGTDYGGVSAASSTYYVDTSLLSTNSQYPRRYRAFLLYAANQFAAISSVTLVSGNQENKTYTQGVPQTYTGLANPIASQYRLWELGDFMYPRPGTFFGVNGGGKIIDHITFTHSTSASRYMAISGIILIPTEQYASVDTVTPVQYRLLISGEPDAPRAMFTTTVLSGASPYSNRSPAEIVLANAAAIAKISDFKLYPPATDFEILQLSDRDATYPQLYSFDATKLRNIIIAYSPRYLHGIA